MGMLFSSISDNCPLLCLVVVNRYLWLRVSVHQYFLHLCVVVLLCIIWQRDSSMPHKRDFPMGVWNILQINNPCNQGYNPEALKLVFGFGRVLRPLS